MLTLKDIEKSIIYPDAIDKLLKKKCEELNKVSHIDAIRDYMTLSTNILKQIDNHTPNSERYLIRKENNCV